MSCAIAALMGVSATPFPLTATANAQNAVQLPPIVVEKPIIVEKLKERNSIAREPLENAPQRAESEPASLAKPLTSTTVKGEDIAKNTPATSDTAALLRNVPGVSLYGAGGVSSLPVIQGLADDRVKVMIDAAMVSAACANHMNPPLSYVDPRQAKSIEVLAGVTPVSKGGDSIGGTILVETMPPEFAAAGKDVVSHGSLSAFWRSNGDGIAISGSASAATSNAAVGYTGAWARAENYEDGAGREVGSTEYETQNHALTLTARKHGDLYFLEAGLQHIPYQGFVNQAMDMTLNDSWHVKSGYEGQFDWGKLEANAYFHHTRHKMNFLDDKLNSFAAIRGGEPSDYSMPMNVEGIDTGYSLKAEIPLSRADLLRIGNEFHHQGLDDWWPPVAGAMMMSPLTYWNINAGTRDRVGTYGEWERKWTPQWATLLGVRNDVVWMDTGDVQPYSWDSMMGMNPDADAAAAFNAKDHARLDVNFDLTALARYEWDATHTIEGGYARKTRSPSLYERYAWGTGSMSSRMISWFGDANGYIGNLGLEPEVAHKLSVTVGWHDAARELWDMKVTPYYSYVEDFITAELVPPAGSASGFNQLKFVNHDAVLYGVDISGRVNMGEVARLGHFTLSGVIGYVHGDDVETDAPLYHMMPWNARLALEHKIGGWTNIVELHLVDDKTRVDGDRLEPSTPGYALVNLRSSYEWENIRLDVGVENLFDKLYYAPLGGINYTDYLEPGHPVAGPGRAFYAGVTMQF